MNKNKAMRLGRRGKEKRLTTVGSKNLRGIPLIVSQTDGLAQPGLRRGIVPVRGPVVPKKELHFLDTGTAPYVCDSTGSVTTLNLIAQGDGNSARTGNQCTMKSVALAGFISANSAATPQKARICLVWDNAPNGALATIANIFQASTANSFHNVDYESRFTFLSDNTFVIGNAAATLADQVVKNFDVDVMLDSVTQYVGAGATQANITNGAILLVTLGTNVAGTSASAFNGGVRVRFFDDSN